MKQNYINIFENEGGSITIAYSNHEGDPQIGEVESISIHKNDLDTIGRELIALADEFEGDE